MTAHMIWTLSTLPSAASALQSSISALERDITAKESEASGLEPWLGRFTLLVAVGVAIEIVVVILDHRKEVKEWRVSELIPEGPSLIKLGMEIASIILVIAGVMGEFGVGLNISSKNGQLRAKSAELRSKSDQLLALVTQQAGNAEDSAKGARKEADSLKADIVSAKQQAADAESHLADALQRAANAEAELYRLKTPRSLVHSDELIAAIKPFSGTEYTLNVFLDDESIQFTKVVAGALDEAGWIRKQPPGIVLGIPAVEIVFKQGASEHVPACIDTGISLHAYAKESLAVLQALPSQSWPKTVQAALALKSAIAPSISPPDERNVVSGVIDPKPAEGIPMTICVGKKP